MGPVTRPPEVRFWVKVDKTGDCWLWMASVKPNGYGQFGVSKDDRSHYAHRFAWEIQHGPIPADLTIDHLCRVRHCVNVQHMELVTREENFRRAVEAWTHCPNGHEYAEGSYIRARNGRRNCLACRQEQIRRGGARTTARDRAARDGVNRKYRLTDTQVASIRAEVAAGASRRETAVKYGCSHQHVDRLVNGLSRSTPVDPVHRIVPAVCDPTASDVCSDQTPCPSCPRAS